MGELLCLIQNPNPRYSEHRPPLPMVSTPGVPTYFQMGGEGTRGWGDPDSLSVPPLGHWKV